MQCKSIISNFEKNVRPSKDDICIFYHENLECFGLMNQSEMQEQMRRWKELLKMGRIYILEENCITATIKGVEYFLLVIQGSDIGMSACSMLFDSLFLVDGLIYMFRTKKTRDTVFKWLEKFCQTKWLNEKQECLICMDEQTTFITKCCKKSLCDNCLKDKKNISCPFCRKEY
jgi:hypothetical protein